MLRNISNFKANLNDNNVNPIVLIEILYLDLRICEIS